MLTECPHCYSDVIVKRDGTCPACLHSVTDLTGTDPDLTKVLLRNGTKDLPRVCIVCGEVATHAVQFTRRARNANYAGDFVAHKRFRSALSGAPS